MQGAGLNKYEAENQFAAVGTAHLKQQAAQVGTRTNRRPHS
jgi:hypothetical protein